MHFFSNHIKSIISLLGIMLFFSCENDIKLVKSLQVDESLPIETTYGVKSIITDSGRVRLRINSPKIDRYDGEKPYMEMTQGLFVVFYDSLGNITSSLKADYAKNIPKEKLFIAKYNVVATNIDGDTLYTELLNWNQKDKKIYTDEAVKVVNADKVIFGKGLTADESFNNWVIKKPTANFQTDIGEDE